jgi:hypothetical protein
VFAPVGTRPQQHEREGPTARSTLHARLCGRADAAHRRSACAQVCRTLLMGQNDVSVPFQAAKLPGWTSTICENVLKELAAFNSDAAKSQNGAQKYKYVVNAIVQQKVGAGVVSAGAIYGDKNTDGPRRLRLSCTGSCRLPYAARAELARLSRAPQEWSQSDGSRTRCRCRWSSTAWLCNLPLSVAVGRMLHGHECVGSACHVGRHRAH